ncbi:hypothetical protein LEP1GSC188_2832 [Leptospira weilii serovar Topaz str. LT2116]|uniref:Uncharacterized protein n=1 Tax=Leptospira weilii serovar Topaz str. LT2116 TaxID=1088540 RepID=M3H166_9LEPT|nr:hypothetical protein LEP1GSC188_2832 [Leptospira weilii serovar Topaz str. LT2116]
MRFSTILKKREFSLLDFSCFPKGFFVNPTKEPFFVYNRLRREQKSVPGYSQKNDIEKNLFILEVNVIN